MIDIVVVHFSAEIECKRKTGVPALRPHVARGLVKSRNTYD